MKKQMLAALVLCKGVSLEIAEAMQSPNEVLSEQKIRYVYEIPFCKSDGTGENSERKLVIIKKLPEDTLAVESYRKAEDGQWKLLFGRMCRGKLTIPVNGEVISLTNIMLPEEIRSQLSKLGHVEEHKEILNADA